MGAVRGALLGRELTNSLPMPSWNSSPSGCKDLRKKETLKLLSWLFPTSGLERRFISTSVRHSAPVSVTSWTPNDQNQSSVIYKHMSVPPSSITDQTRKPHIQLRLLREGFSVKTAIHNLQNEVIVHVSSVEKQHVGNSCPEA
ncbi:hypothetical protein F7725_015171 [Dissostichus mawsoni]|uniref:Uncharacterized protein n=1 Tax=Dissostichus mawsoni TaxID=36200 RepID=A0A7J5YGS3_DISMA|nr:hypothetical protein F7725_015171 [Dissostichus mawsoni]